MLAKVMNIRRISQVMSNHSYKNIRCLYSASTLGIDLYETTRKKTETQLKGAEDKFREKMREFTSSSKELIFTDDLKQILHLAQPTDDDLKLVIKMIRKFSSQCDQLRFGSYIFGPIVMRMYYFFNKPNDALTIYKDPSLSSIFDQMSSHMILMDLLFKNGMFSEVLEVYQIFRDKQILTGKFQRGIIMLVLASCYKLNTADSFNFVQKLWKEMQDSGVIQSGRSFYFVAGLALKQNSPHIALDIISSCQKHSSIGVRSIKILSFIYLDRLDDAILVLQGIFATDSPYRSEHDSVCADAVEALKNAILKSEDKVLISKFERTEKQLKEYNLIASFTFDSFILSEIDFKDNRKQNENEMLKSAFSGHRRNNSMQRMVRHPGLSEMV